MLAIASFVIHYVGLASGESFWGRSPEMGT
jgi:hypothetical protein